MPIIFTPPPPPLMLYHHNIKLIDSNRRRKMTKSRKIIGVWCANHAFLAPKKAFLNQVKNVKSHLIRRMLRAHSVRLDLVRDLANNLSKDKLIICRFRTNQLKP